MLEIALVIIIIILAICNFVEYTNARYESYVNSRYTNTKSRGRGCGCGCRG
jgi:hypothetical protein